MNKGLQDFISFWQNVFSSENPIKALGLNHYEQYMTHLQINCAPEPYYGYFHDDMTNDVLLLLLNPGAKDELTSEREWNQSIKERYINLWTKEEYHRQEEILKSQNTWRDKRLNQAKGIVGEVGFLHTMEFFPFHSKKDELTERFKSKWVNDFSISDLAFYALKDIAINRKVKHIFCVSNDWGRILEKHYVPLQQEVILKKRGGKGYSFHFKVYQIEENSLPILFCDLKGSPINLPRNPLAVEIARILLGIINKPLPQKHPLFEITINK